MKNVQVILLCVAGALVCANDVQAIVVATEDFESYNASAGTGTNLAGQGAWTILANSPTIRNDFTVGSLDGKVYYSDDSAGSVSYRHDGVSYVAASDKAISIEFTGRMSVTGTPTGRWSRAGVGHFDGVNLNPGLYFGAFGTSWGVALGSGTGAGTVLATSTDGFPANSTIFDLQLLVDLDAKTATLFVENSELAGIDWFTPAGMANFSVAGLDTSALDGKNPLNWNSLYIRSIAAGDTIDNIVIITTPIPEPSTCALAALGLLSLGMTRRAKAEAGR